MNTWVSGVPLPLLGVDDSTSRHRLPPPLYQNQVLLAVIQSHPAVSSKLGLLRVMQWQGRLIA